MAVYVQLIPEHCNPSVPALSVLLSHLTKGSLPKEQHDNMTLVLLLFAVAI